MEQLRWMRYCVSKLWVFTLRLGFGLWKPKSGLIDMRFGELDLIEFQHSESLGNRGQVLWKMMRQFFWFKKNIAKWREEEETICKRKANKCTSWTPIHCIVYNVRLRKHVCALGKPSDFEWLNWRLIPRRFLRETDSEADFGTGSKSDLLGLLCVRILRFIYTKECALNSSLSCWLRRLWWSGRWPHWVAIVANSEVGRTGGSLANVAGPCVRLVHHSL